MYVDQLEVIMQKIIKQKKNLKFDFTVHCSGYLLRVYGYDLILMRIVICGLYTGFTLVTDRSLMPGAAK